MYKKDGMMRIFLKKMHLRYISNKLILYIA